MRRLLGRLRARRAERLAARASERFRAGDWRRAADGYRRALKAAPERADYWNRLGVALKELGMPGEAERCFARTAALAPHSAAALSNAASAQRDLGRTEAALETFRAAVRLAPDNPDILSAYLFTLNLAPGLSRERIFEEHLQADRVARAVVGAPRRHAPRVPKPRLRIGYLSPDLRFHAVALFLQPVLQHRDPEKFEAWCYHLHPSVDATSRKLMALADGWVHCAKWPPAEIAQRIADDGIDILVDLAGHTDWNAFPALALKPAPVIASWLGYLNTTGLRSVDYRITDPTSDPPGETERFHTEKLVRLPQTQWCRERPPDEPGVSALPAAQSGSVRFGSFNRALKLAPETLRLWAGLLLRLPGARLLVAGTEPSRGAEIRALLSDAGIAPDRIDFAGPLPHGAFRALHHGVDIALDAYPYSGATTTLDSLWMGVPTLTLTGEGPMSRSTASILHALGLEEWIADSPEAFVELGVRHASDLARLSALRASLRDRLGRSILLDGARFTRQLEALYQRMWSGADAAT